MARRHFFVRECVENHLIRVPFVRTDANDADFFTKVLPSRKFFPLRDKIMNVPAHLRWDAASASASRDSYIPNLNACNPRAPFDHGGALRGGDLTVPRHSHVMLY